MKEILFIAHRIPYPPNKGDKIRSFHILKHLSQSFRVHLGAFVDDPQDWQYEPVLKALCGETKLLPLFAAQAKLRSLSGLVTGEALSLPYYRNAAMSSWVDSIVRDRPLCGVLVFSSAMAQYVEKYDSQKRVIDFVDVDSDKWLQYAEKKIWPLNWIYRREGRRLLEYDRRMANRLDRSLFVSDDEAALFRRLAPESAEKVFAMENGVDTKYFDGTAEYVNPYPEDIEALIFTGAMDYWANVDAVSWMAKEIFPEILRLRPRARFYIVGARPGAEVTALGKREGVVVTGAVHDIRPYLAHSRLALAPMRIARGVQNKVLEALAMSKPLMASTSAMEGINASTLLDVKVADSTQEWIYSILGILDNSSMPAYSQTNRSFVLEKYSWDQNLSQLDKLWGEA